ncbi:hypothetical protein Vi05172_g1041 [Venturia inaequalis]|nr:hypothetical protein Vi05172_g1041 [Venturia inaequalis]
MAKDNDVKQKPPWRNARSASVESVDSSPPPRRRRPKSRQEVLTREDRAESIDSSVPAPQRLDIAIKKIVSPANVVNAPQKEALHGPSGHTSKSLIQTSNDPSKPTRQIIPQKSREPLVKTSNGSNRRHSTSVDVNTTLVQRSDPADDEEDTDHEDLDLNAEDEEEASLQALLNEPPAPSTSSALMPSQLVGLEHNRYMVALQKGYSKLLFLVFEDEKKKRKSLDKMDFRIFNTRGWNVLAATPTPMLCALAAGDLPRMVARRDPAVLECINMFKRTKALEKCPCIYLISLCNSQGEGPTAREWTEIAYHLMQYAQVDRHDKYLTDLAFEVDCIGHPDHKTKRAKNLYQRRYLKSKDDQTVGKNMPSPTKVNRMRKFSGAQTSRANKVAKSDWDTKRLHGFYGGYALSPRSRWHSHKASPSSYLMAATYAVCEVKWPGRYQLQEFAISPIVDPDDASYGEIIISAIAGCMYDTGEGFNIADPGDSVHSINTMNIWHRRWVDIWVAQHSPYYANIIEQTRIIHDENEESEQAREDVKPLKQEMEELKRLKETTEEKAEELQGLLISKVNEHLREEIAINKALVELDTTEFTEATKASWIVESTQYLIEDQEMIDHQ